MAEAKERSLISKEIFGKLIVELGHQYPNIVVGDTDLMRCFGTKAFSKEFPKRHINFGIAEQNCMAASAGMALCGKNVFSSSFANFATKRACDQVSIAVCYNKANVKVCGLYAGLTAEKNGGTHIGVEDVAIMRSFPGMAVVEAADTYELEAITRYVAEYEGPVYFRQPKMYLHHVYDDVPEFELGKARVIKEGTDAVLIACGITVAIAMDAAALLEEKGICAAVINMPSIKPIDEETVKAYASHSKAVVTVENHSVIGGLGSAVAEVMAGNGINTKLERIGLRDCFGMTATLAYQLEANGLTREAVANKVEKALNNINKNK
ncbi:transketolase family protein [Lactonifactor longoviformis]|uniref:transketolase family protein n=1 Tax=Lactonifactor longoviformis TaxID=341220 RepID=UPI0036F3C094